MLDVIMGCSRKEEGGQRLWGCWASLQEQVGPVLGSRWGRTVAEPALVPLGRRGPVQSSDEAVAGLGPSVCTSPCWLHAFLSAGPDVNAALVLEQKWEAEEVAVVARRASCPKHLAPMSSANHSHQWQF